jgi:hypothetical protein
MGEGQDEGRCALILADRCLLAPKRLAGIHASKKQIHHVFATGTHMRESGVTAPHNRIGDGRLPGVSPLLQLATRTPHCGNKRGPNLIWIKKAAKKPWQLHSNSSRSLGKGFWELELQGC